MERSLFGFILKYSRKEQLLIVPLVVLSMVFYYASLDLPMYCGSWSGSSNRRSLSGPWITVSISTPLH